ncbi:hypothetical protein HanXRQr2_Chr10g0424501 [Helianthus annuus]|uniref:Uncharacterized protein n=1 Tax=Helianthus annuus TaxID=4232 RepID=A0A9K3N3I6_HELAN|nr:hypothetical protein HanXRQr2_Chr10g0424501 [Helianthus annuus]KAJ0512691.1 hypothetical protein HanHA300_Chr10g0349011 [Helianthus annuus]KAJ0528819.1 hypothetical protein HanHA89_Chr10g0370621 [Helianthus annuus]KAJ0695732.1 hypothetical protein HanLR1_Chr10g0348821 [Helianthus annuus]
MISGLSNNSKPALKLKRHSCLEFKKTIKKKKQSQKLYRKILTTNEQTLKLRSLKNFLLEYLKFLEMSRGFRYILSVLF